jgi:hypothetical protein
MLYHGLPIVYYGTEQPAIAGLADQRTYVHLRLNSPRHTFATMACLLVIRGAMLQSLTGCF